MEELKDELWKSLELPSSTPGRDRYMHQLTFLCKFNPE